MLPFRFLGFLDEDKLLWAVGLFGLKPNCKKSNLSLRNSIKLEGWMFSRCPTCSIDLGCISKTLVKKSLFRCTRYSHFFWFLCVVWKITHSPRVQNLVKPRLYKQLCWMVLQLETKIRNYRVEWSPNYILCSSYWRNPWRHTRRCVLSWLSWIDHTLIEVWNKRTKWRKEVCHSSGMTNPLGFERLFVRVWAGTLETETLDSPLKRRLQELYEWMLFKRDGSNYKLCVLYYIWCVDDWCPVFIVVFHDYICTMWKSQIFPECVRKSTARLYMLMMSKSLLSSLAFIFPPFTVILWGNIVEVINTCSRYFTQTL